VIGDEENRGISGGQRKRVNIAMELVASINIMLLY
jgi:ABC-type multidrug transport system ATPase subunit